MIDWVQMVHSARVRSVSTEVEQGTVSERDTSLDAARRTEARESIAAEEAPLSAETWSEVGKQFKELGQSIAAAFRIAWEHEENRQHIKAMREGLESMMVEINDLLKHTASIPETLRVREQAQKAAESARLAGQIAFEEARPYLLAALRQLDAELQKLIAQMEKGQLSKQSSSANHHCS
ncbi:MAG: hypothetical protein DDG58_08560 [Ardenticatenia bacterium]|jgi:signal recognition particle GTPase|nr:MAG: hypothetical protein DDG58_08560 [Ardenticatenia bacterium]